MNPRAVTGMVNQRWGATQRKVWVEVCCQGQTLLTLLKTKIVHLLPLLNQETLCYDPDSFLFHTQN